MIGMDYLTPDARAKVERWEAQVNEIDRDEVERLRGALCSIIVNLDGENEDGNIFPAAALRIAREAMNRSIAPEATS